MKLAAKLLLGWEIASPRKQRCSKDMLIASLIYLYVVFEFNRNLFMGPTGLQTTGFFLLSLHLTSLEPIAFRSLSWLCNSVMVSPFQGLLRLHSYLPAKRSLSPIFHATRRRRYRWQLSSVSTRTRFDKVAGKGLSVKSCCTVIC